MIGQKVLRNAETHSSSFELSPFFETRYYGHTCACVCTSECAFMLFMWFLFIFVCLYVCVFYVWMRVRCACKYICCVPPASGFVSRLCMLTHNDFNISSCWGCACVCMCVHVRACNVLLLTSFLRLIDLLYVFYTHTPSTIFIL